MRSYDQRLLKKNHATFRPTRILYYDSETKTAEKSGEVWHRMKMGWTCYVQTRQEPRKNTEKWLFWNDAEAFCKYLEGLCKIKTKLYLFGHNIFFDLQASDFFYWFTKWGWKLDFVYDKGLTYMLRIHKDKRHLVILSTTNFYPVSLKVLGDIVGIRKKEVDFEKSTETELKEYCRQDVEIIKATMEKWLAFLDLHDLGGFAMSKAGQSFKAYRHRFMDVKLNLHNEEDIVALEREAYMGGRVECGFIGKCKQGPFVSLDINSMYPYVMRNKMYPTRLIDYIEAPDIETIREFLPKFLMVAEVDLETDEPAYAVRHDGKVIFPVGDFRAFLCTPGLEYALSRDHLRKVYRAALYEKNSIFPRYVDYFYALKLKYKREKDATMEMISKHFLNNLYGKFAQTAPMIDKEEDITFDGYYREEILDAVTGKMEIVTKLFNKLFIQYGTEPAKTSFAAIAAHVTEYARFYLYEIMRDTGLNRILYCDTDSLKIRVRDLEHVKTAINSRKLGALKKEGTTKKLVIHGPKDYETDTERVLKGVPATAEKLSETKYAFTYFPGQSTHLRRQITRAFITRPMTKTLKRVYEKGRVLKSGRVKPFVFSGGQLQP